VQKAIKGQKQTTVQRSCTASVNYSRRGTTPNVQPPLSAGPPLHCRSFRKSGPSGVMKNLVLKQPLRVKVGRHPKCGIGRIRPTPKFKTGHYSDSEFNGTELIANLRSGPCRAAPGTPFVSGLSLTP
jgi:hypothetical protein